MRFFLTNPNSDALSWCSRCRRLSGRLALAVALCLGIAEAHAQRIASCQLQPFGVITVSPDFELDGEGRNVDTIDLWEARKARNTLMFVTAKDNSLIEVWKYPFVDNEQSPLVHSTFKGSQVNGVIVDQESNRLYVSIGPPSNTVSVFTLPKLDFVMNFNKDGVRLSTEPNLALLKLDNEKKRIYLSSDDVVYIHDAETGKYLDEFTPEKGLETIAGDDYYQALYIPDENDRTGVYVYHPDGTPYNKNGSNNFGDGVFEEDAEGVWIYRIPSEGSRDDGCGLILVSDQRSKQTDFEFFDRKSWQHLGTLRLKGVSNTDGICSFQEPLPAYPMGLFLAINNDGTTAGVGWDVIFSAMGLTLEVDSETQVATTFSVNRNYPNPFNPSTTIDYQLPRSTDVKLVVYDALGRHVRTLVDGYMTSGHHQVIWNGRNDDGIAVSSGTYICRFDAGGFSETRRMTLVK